MNPFTIVLRDFSFGAASTSLFVCGDKSAKSNTESVKRATAKTNGGDDKERRIIGERLIFCGLILSILRGSCFVRNGCAAVALVVAAFAACWLVPLASRLAAAGELLCIMLAGAAEFRSRPEKSSECLNCIERKGRGEKRRENVLCVCVCYVLCACGAKGDVGRCATKLNLSNLFRVAF